MQILWSQTVIQRETKTTTINQGNAGEMLAYASVLGTRTPKNKPDQTEKKNNLKTKKADRSSEECDARSERLHCVFQIYSIRNVNILQIPVVPYVVMHRESATSAYEQ